MGFNVLLSQFRDSCPVRCQLLSFKVRSGSLGPLANYLYSHILLLIIQVIKLILWNSGKKMLLFNHLICNLMHCHALNGPHSIIYLPASP